MPLEAPKAIKFVGHQVSSEGKKQFGTYTIRCQDRDGHEWTCEKRYSEFDALRKALLKDKCEKVKQFENLEHGKGKFPKKGGKSTDPTVMKTRQHGLNMWLSSVLKFYGENLNVCAFFKEVAAIKRDVGVDRLSQQGGGAAAAPVRRALLPAARPWRRAPGLLLTPLLPIPPWGPLRTGPLSLISSETTRSSEGSQREHILRSSKPLTGAGLSAGARARGRGAVQRTDAHARALALRGGLWRGEAAGGGDGAKRCG